ncbi:MAG: hypothetical protein K2Y37_04415 [Pirellulales bacterium]|nr:hypothetical protein [Pirellulales bacterium]
MTRPDFVVLSALITLVVLTNGSRTLAEDDGTRDIVFDKYVVKAPEKFTRQTPRSKIIAYEFSVPAADGDEQPGRLTVMSAGGTIEANLDRWYAQFAQPDGSSTRNRAKVEKKTVAGHDVHFVNIAGTYDDKPAPFAAQGVARENYRMLGAIVVLPEGNVYFKFYGPRQTIADNQEAFRKMIEAMKTK